MVSEAPQLLPGKCHFSPWIFNRFIQVFPKFLHLGHSIKFPNLWNRFKRLFTDLPVPSPTVAEMVYAPWLTLTFVHTKRSPIHQESPALLGLLTTSTLPGSNWWRMWGHVGHFTLQEASQLTVQLTEGLQPSIWETAPWTLHLTWLQECQGPPACESRHLCRVEEAMPSSWKI